MLQRRFGFLEFSSQEAPKATHTLEESGYAVLPQVFSAGQVEELRTDIERVFSEFPPDPRPSTEAAGKDDVFRYEMLNRSAVCQDAVAAPAVLVEGMRRWARSGAAIVVPGGATARQVGEQPGIASAEVVSYEVPLGGPRRTLWLGRTL